MSTYNGWTNKETWLANLWMTNDEGTYNFWMEQAREHEDARSLAEAMEEGHEAQNPFVHAPIWSDPQTHALFQASFWSDLLTHALAGVNWYEIAEHLLEDAQDEEETNERR